MSDALNNLREIDTEIQLLTHSAALLQWDQETGMPSKAIKERSDQLALLEGMIHDRLTHSDVKKNLEAAGFTSSADVKVDEKAEDFHEKAFLRAFGRNWEQAVKIPRRLVTEFAKATSQGQAAWIEARKENSFAKFQPHLQKILDLNREKAEALGYQEQIYDALLDQFEPGMPTREVSRVFGELQTKLTPLVQKITSAQKGDDSFRHKNYPKEPQREFSLRVLEDMGYEFDRGRLNESAHPFTTSLGGDDVRVTTRYNEKDLFNALFGTIHEGGHALYELGINPEFHGSVLGEGTSLGVHESQSRTWENIIGRGVEFWKHYFPILKREYFPEQLKEMDFESFILGVNKVEPSLIRINADEVTYSLHVILRFELELALVNGDLQVADLPGAWNEGMERLLGITPDKDANGVLQDVHWSMGAIGYFPTYALGNLFGAQFFNTLRREMPDVDERISKGDLSSIREWQREHIHQYGSALTASELCTKVNGEALNPKYFIEYLEKKFGDLDVL